MTKNDYLAAIDSVSIDEDAIERVKAVYGKDLPLTIQQIVSYSRDTVFFDGDSRILSFSEILEAKEDLHVDFVSLGLLPVADCGENNFIVFHMESGKWSKFNIVDETRYKIRAEFSELL